MRSCSSLLSPRSRPGGQSGGGLATQLPMETKSSPTSVCHPATTPPKIAAPPPSSMPARVPGRAAGHSQSPRGLTWPPAGIGSPGGEGRARKRPLLPGSILCKCHIFRDCCFPHKVGEQLSRVLSQAMGGGGCRGEAGAVWSQVCVIKGSGCGQLAGSFQLGVGLPSFSWPLAPRPWILDVSSPHFLACPRGFSSVQHRAKNRDPGAKWPGFKFRLCLLFYAL